MEPTTAHFNYESIFDQFILSGDSRRYWAEQSLFDDRGEFNEFRSLRIHGPRQSGKTTALVKQLTKHPEIQAKLLYPGEAISELHDIEDKYFFYKNENTPIPVEELYDVEVLLIDDGCTRQDLRPKTAYWNVVELWYEHRDQFHPNFSIIMVE